MMEVAAIEPNQNVRKKVSVAVSLQVVVTMINSEWASSAVSLQVYHHWRCLNGVKEPEIPREAVYSAKNDAKESEDDHASNTYHFVFPINRTSGPV